MRDPRKSLERRTLLAGAGSVGALAAAVSVLPSAQPAATPAAAQDAKAAPDSAAGYRLTEHIKRYYASTRI
jgi:hypothetical protein